MSPMLLFDELQRQLVRYVILGLFLFVGVGSVGGFLAGRFRDRAADRAVADQHQRALDTVWAIAGRLSDSLVAVTEEREQLRVGLQVARQATDGAIARSRAAAAAGQATIASARTRVAELTAGNAAVLAEFDRVETAYDSLAGENARLVAAAAQERVGTDQLFAADSTITDLQRQLAEALDSAATLERTRPAPPRLATYFDGGYAVAVDSAGSGSAPYAALGTRLRLTERLELHARADYVLPPVQQARAAAFFRVLF